MSCLLFHAHIPLAVQGKSVHPQRSTSLMFTAIKLTASQLAEMIVMVSGILHAGISFEIYNSLQVDLKKTAEDCKEQPLWDMDLQKVIRHR